MLKIALISVSDQTGLIPFVKRLHEAGIEITSTGSTAEAIKGAGIPYTLVETIGGFDVEPFYLVAINLCPFANNPSIENIDVDGPSMIRAAAKSYRSVIVIVDPGAYDKTMERIEQGKDVDAGVRLLLATKAFEHCANYDHSVAEHFRACVKEGTHPK